MTTCLGVRLLFLSLLHHVSLKRHTCLSPEKKILIEKRMLNAMNNPLAYVNNESYCSTIYKSDSDDIGYVRTVAPQTVEESSRQAEIFVQK